MFSNKGERTYAASWLYAADANITWNLLNGVTVADSCGHILNASSLVLC